MSGTTLSANLPARTDRKVYIVWIAMVWAAILGGFGFDYARYLHESPLPPVLLHVHAAVYVSWLVLVSVQILLVEAGNVRLHMRLGWAVAILSAVMVPLGLAAAFVDQARQVSHPDYAPQFLALEFEEMFAFSAFIIAGLLTRKSLAEHKRFMILAAVAISDAGFARIWQMKINYTFPGRFGWWLQYFWGITLMLIAMLAWDWFKHKRIMRSVLWGAALLWGGEAIVTILNFSPPWKASMANLVRMWGYAG
jgi:hypothetical protein